MEASMSECKVVASKEDGNNKVRVLKCDAHLSLHIMGDGIQWTGVCVDEELLTMIRDTINDYFVDNL